MVQTRDDEASRQAGVSARLVRPGDEEQMLRVLEAAFGGWPQFDISVDPIDHLRWKLQGYDPELPRLNIVALMGPRIAGVRMNVMRRVRIGGHERLMSLGTDAATDPQLQGKGLYSALRAASLEAQRDAVDMRIGWTTHAAMLRLAASDPEHTRRLDNKVLIKVMDIERLTRGSGANTSLLRRSGLTRALAFRALEVAHRLTNRRGQLTFHGQIKRIEAFDERFEAFWSRASAGHDFIAERTPAFLNWRYIDQRGGDHIAFAAEENGEVAGYIVVRASRGRGQILDVLALPGRNDAVSSLVSHVDGFFTEAGLYAAECRIAARHPYERIFSQYGFIDPRRESNFYYTGQRLSREELALMESRTSLLHLSDGDL